jgi:hypothetical protein
VGVLQTTLLGFLFRPSKTIMDASKIASIMIDSHSSSSRIIIAANIKNLLSYEQVKKVLALQN